jgi:hypothetical protein
MILHVLTNPDCVADASLRDEEESLVGIEVGAEKFIGDFRRERS